MSSPAQIAANIENAKSSTGPRTDEGKATSAKNAVTFGLFSGDFIRPGEHEGYSALFHELIEQLAPCTLLEDILVEEIHRAHWRLRRCGQVESHLAIFLDDKENYILDPMETTKEGPQRIQKSVDRARSQAHRILHKSLAELRKLQAERKAAEAKEAAAAPATSEESASLCVEQSQAAQTPRNATCPCGSNQKYKRCCGKSAPPVLNNALRNAA